MRRFWDTYPVTSWTPRPRLGQVEAAGSAEGPLGPTWVAGACPLGASPVPLKMLILFMSGIIELLVKLMIFLSSYGILPGNERTVWNT